MATAFFGNSAIVGEAGEARRNLDVVRGDRASAVAVVTMRDVYATLGPKIRRFCASALGPQVADDALQETFARAYRAEPKPVQAEWVPWIYGIARNVIREMTRSRARTQRYGHDDELHELPAPHPSPEESCAHNERAHRLAAALTMLSEERRVILLLRAQEGLSCDEIARALSISVAKVKVDIHRARNELRSRMGESESGEEA